VLRLNIFQRSGIADFALSLWRNPPHAPYSTAAAIVAFAVAGPWRGAAYFMNAVAVFLITCFWLRMFRVSLGLGVLLAVILITTRWFDEVITVFHPDLITGYAAAVVAAALVFQNEVLTSVLRPSPWGLRQDLPY
jgi:energy-coupling factor transporter transmembrane protein EcfT